jgi:hypothetical protein
MYTNRLPVIKVSFAHFEKTYPEAAVGSWQWHRQKNFEKHFHKKSRTLLLLFSSTADSRLPFKT